MKPIHGTEEDNWIGRREEEGNLPVILSLKNINPTEDDKYILCYVGITIDYDNDISPENVPEQQEKQKWNKQQGGKVWKPEGIIWPHKANNVQKYFVYFWNYMK